MNKYLLSWLLLLLSIAPGSYAQPANDYLKTMNSYLPGSPEAAQLMKYQDYPVNLYTGTPQISIPIYTVTGQGIALPVSLSYHAGGGVNIDNVATFTGLGWSLAGVGEITREVRGVADDEGGGFFSQAASMPSYLQKTEDLTNPDNFQLWAQAGQGEKDMEPDIFYFSFGGYSGKFLYDYEQMQFTCLNETAHFNIAFDAAGKTWTIIADDGNKYVFAAKETSTTSIINRGVNGTITPPGAPEITSWKLSRIVNADATDSIVLNYVSNSYTYMAPGSNAVYQLIQGYAGTRQPLNTFSQVTISGTSKLSSITGRLFSVFFEDEAAYRTDLDGQKALGRIIVKNSAGDVQDIFVLHHSYFNRANGIGDVPPSGTYYNSLRLDSLSEYGQSETAPYPLRHAFRYNSPDKLPRRLSFEKDFWGYANYNTISSLVPPMVYVNGSTQASYTGGNRMMDPSRCKAAILDQVRLPTGGTVTYTYEPNTIGYPIPQAAANGTISVNNLINEWKLPGESYSSTPYRDSFVVNQPPNPAINGSQGGVVADITIWPVAPNPNAPNAPTGTNSSYPYFMVAKYQEANGDPTGSNTFSRTLQYGNQNSVYLPNGRYVIIAYDAQKLNASPFYNTERQLVCSVTYNILDTTQSNYNIAGVRVRSIVTTDPYTNTVQTRNFRYHNPDTDSSYGEFIGTTLNNFTETSGLAGGVAQYLVRMGSSNMPGLGNAACNVVYRRVIEETSDSGVTYRTDHYYTRGPLRYPEFGRTWPFIPYVDQDWTRGNDSATVQNKYISGYFYPAAIQKKVYNINPVSQSSAAPYFRTLYGIKAASNSYDGSTAMANGYAPQFVLKYPILLNRQYLTSDSTIVYDLNNIYRSTTTWHDYQYGDYNHQPLVIRSGNSDGSVSVQKSYYASDRPDADAEISAAPLAALSSQLVAANRVTLPLAVKQYKDGQLLSRQYTYAHFDGSRLLTDSIRQALYSDAPDKEVSVSAYDASGNPLSIAMRGNKYRKYLWQQSSGLPLATCLMQKDVSFAFTSFEYPDEYSWNDNARGTADAFAGQYSYDLGGGSITFPGFIADGGLDVYVWALGSDVMACGQQMENTGRTKGAWTLYTRHLTASPSGQITAGPGAGQPSALEIAGTARIDQLIIVPSGSRFQGNVYGPNNRPVAVTADDIVTGFLEYDSFNRLQQVRDEQGNILNATSYQYQGAQ